MAKTCPPESKLSLNTILFELEGVSKFVVSAGLFGAKIGFLEKSTDSSSTF